jgi:DNA ligase-1
MQQNFFPQNLPFKTWMYLMIQKVQYLVYCRVPYLALARTLEAIEGVSARLKIIEILANYFRSVIVLSPDDLLPSVYLCLNKLAPAYEGTYCLCFYALFVSSIFQC